MAKRKNAAALFEVIHADKRFANSGGGFSIPPLSWFGRKRKEADGPTSTQAAPVETPVMSASSEPSRLWNFLPSMPKVAMALDPDRQVVSFKLSYTTALVSAFALVAVIALAFVVGKATSRRSLPALADQSTEELRNGPAQPDVLEVGRDDSPVAMAAAPLPSRQASPTPNTPAKPSNAQSARPTWSEPKPPTTFIDTNQKRTVNLHYVIVQSYPKEEKQMADEACQLLNRNGILCTVETGLYYAPTWYAVVGVSGFDRIRNSPEYDAYVARIEQVGEKFGGGSKFKKFEPKAFRWRESKAQ